MSDAKQGCRWFGRRHDAAAYTTDAKTRTPIGAICVHCQEMIAPEDDGWISSNGVVFHRACFVRGFVGSVAHLERRCGCFIPGSAEGDPPELTVREAAELALVTFEAMPRTLRNAQSWDGDDD